jgi:hypothetical protein
MSHGSVDWSWKEGFLANHFDTAFFILAAAKTEAMYVNTVEAVSGTSACAW